MTSGSVQILGVRLDPLTIGELHSRIEDAIREGRRLAIGSQNLHGVFTFHRSEVMRQFQREALVRIDGMPLVFAARACGFRVRRDHRVTWVDWLAPLFSFADAQGWSIQYCGATAQTIETARREVVRRYPSLKFFARDGYFADEDDERRFVNEVNERRVDILIVGMGMPRQEGFLIRHGRELTTPVLLTSGAAIEYFAGAVSEPPRWMGRVGLEWLFRLAGSPRRFAYRYLVEPWALLPLFLRDLWHYRVRGGRF